MVPPWIFYSPFGTPKEARTIIGSCCRTFSNGKFCTLWTWILKKHYFLFTSSSSLCAPLINWWCHIWMEPLVKTIKRQDFPQAPSPTMTNFFFFASIAIFLPWILYITKFSSHVKQQKSKFYRTDKEICNYFEFLPSNLLIV